MLQEAGYREDKKRQPGGFLRVGPECSARPESATHAAGTALGWKNAPSEVFSFPNSQLRAR